MSFLHDLKIAIRSLARVPSLWITVGLTLALGIGANAAIFSVVRAVLLRPLANQDESRLLYVRQSAPGIGEANATFSVPEIQDPSTAKLKTIKEFGTFSEIDFTIVGLGTPREIPAGVVDGNYFRGDGASPGAGAAAWSRGRRAQCCGRYSSDVQILADSSCTPIRACWARRCALRVSAVRVRQRLWACWSRRFPTRWPRRSSPTW